MPEVVIVGGGVVGLSVAYNLAARGVSEVLVLESNLIGKGSTARCAGGVRAQFSTEVNVRIGVRSEEILATFEEQFGSTADFRRIGYMFLASTEELAESFRRNLEVQQRAGLHRVSEIGLDEVRRLVPFLQVDDIVTATFCPDDGIAGPNEVTQGYATAARRLGVTIREGAELQSIEVGDGGVRAVTAAGERHETRVVVNCAGPWSASVAQMAGLNIPVRPFRRHAFVTDPIEFVTRDTPMTVDLATTFYFHPEGDGLLLGMSDLTEASSFDTDVDWSFLEKLIDRAVVRAPRLAEASVASGWAGLYEVTPDHQAILGRTEIDGFWCACGFSGHGFMQAPAVGEIVADLITGAEPDIDVAALGPGRFAAGALLPELNVI